MYNACNNLKIMETKKEKILEKLRKLMKLKESATELGNEGEANAAAARITHLLMLYNLSEDDIPEQEKLDNPVISEEIPFKATMSDGAWYTNLISVVCEQNLCRPLIIRTKHNGRMERSKFQIVGRKKNVEIVLFLISFLSNQFVMIGKRDYKEYKSVCIRKYDTIPKTPAIYLKSFLYGCILGLNDKFEETKKQFEETSNLTALMVTTGNEIDFYLKDEHIKAGRKNGTPTIDPLSAIRGIETGRNIEISKGIYAETISEDRRLQ